MPGTDLANMADGTESARRWMGARRPLAVADLGRAPTTALGASRVMRTASRTTPTTMSLM